MRHPESSCRNVSELGEHQQHEPDDISMPEDWNTTGAQITAWALGDRALRLPSSRDWPLLVEKTHKGR
jgi:hypothetical protein